MAVKFADVVDMVRGLDTESKEYLADLIKKQLIEERRKEIKRHAREALKEYRRGKIKFGTVEYLKKDLYAD